MKTSETNFRSKYNGSAVVDMLEESPRMVVLWAGYSFSKDKDPVGLSKTNSLIPLLIL
jgi:formate-dependent nitrite reductase cytochrome c552 subunit